MSKRRLDYWLGPKGSPSRDTASILLTIFGTVVLGMLGFMGAAWAWVTLFGAP